MGGLRMTINKFPLFNSEYDIPMAINLTKLSQNIKNGELLPEILTNISSNSVQGFWFPFSR
ncbi:MAG: hypothetical protein CM1200mP16_03830 [Nitrospina sp.]|nr:MAG: hypothetical protein CM1200mP16_03830 [Nitrospina sp.]